MNKADLMENLRRETGLRKDKAEEVVNILFKEMSDALVKGGRVEIRGFCSFYVKDYKSYTGRNPKTGDQVRIAPKRLPFFKCGKELKERVDEQPSQP
jgi:integration host factor subunit beta